MAVTVSTQISQLYVALFGRAPDATGLAYWVQGNASGDSISTIATQMFAVEASREYYPADISNADIVANFYVNVLGREAGTDTEGQAYWESALNTTLANGGTVGDVLVQIIFAVVNHVDMGDGSAENAAALNSQKLFANKVEVADYYADKIGTVDGATTVLSGVTESADTVTAAKTSIDAVDTGTDGGTTGTTQMLATSQDFLTGTEGNDTFNAYIFDNSNTLQSGDVITGGAGTDILSADIGNSQVFAITAQTTGVETVSIRAQAVSRDSTDNNTSATNEVQIDAQRMQGVTKWESNNSRADLLIEDVRIQDNQITSNITIAMVETDAGHVDLGVYFDQYSLRAQSNSSSTLVVELADTRSLVAGTAALLDNPYSQFSFKMDGKIQIVESAAINAAQTYPELLAAIQAAIALNPDLANVTASLGSVVQRADTLTGTLVGVTQILLTSNTAVTFTSDNETGWKTPTGTVPASSGLHTDIQTLAPTSNTDLVTSKIILDDVGRGSTGGDLVVGGLSVGDTSTSKGVERFEIEVRDNSKLQTINSTNNTLEEVAIVNGKTTSDVITNAYGYMVSTKDAGNLTVNGSLTAANADASGTINEALPGTDTVNGGDQHNAFGFSDVRVIDASAMTGKLAFTAEITEASIDKYINLTDTGAPAADNVDFVYTGGSNNDTMTIQIDGNVFASNSRVVAGREDFTFTANGGAGDDNINLSIVNNNALTGNSDIWYANQKLNANVYVNGGEGNDTIRTFGAGDVKISAGAGNDTVYTDNTGSKAAFVLNATNTTLANLQSSGNASTNLYKGEVTVTFMGLTAKATIADTGYKTSDLQVNQAIKSAINSDPVLSKLLVATDGPANTLVVTALIDGVQSASLTNGGFSVSIAAPAADTVFSAADLTGLIAAYNLAAGSTSTQVLDAMTTSIAATKTADYTAQLAETTSNVEITGASSSAVSDNIINLGAGNDVLVLGTGANSNETVVFSGYDLGTKTIVNYTTDTTSTAVDHLNFASYLNNLNLVAQTANSDATVEANSTTLLTATFTSTNTFAGLTGATLLAAINSTNAGTADYAGLTSATFDAANGYTTTTLVGGVGKAIVMIENSANLGEYKVFELSFNGTSTNTTKDFTAATLISTVDFGSTVTVADGGGTDVVTSEIALTSGTTADVAATADADVFTFDVADALATVGTQITVTDFDVAADLLTIDTITALGATTLDALNGVDGITVQTNSITNETLINFGFDAEFGTVAVTLTGVSDASLININAI